VWRPSTERSSDAPPSVCRARGGTTPAAAAAPGQGRAARGASGGAARGGTRAADAADAAGGVTAHQRGRIAGAAPDAGVAEQARRTGFRHRRASAHGGSTPSVRTQRKEPYQPLRALLARASVAQWKSSGLRPRAQRFDSSRGSDTVAERRGARLQRVITAVRFRPVSSRGHPPTPKRLGSGPAGRGAAWLARQSGGLEVPSSNLGAPTGKPRFCGAFSLRRREYEPTRCQMSVSPMSPSSYGDEVRGHRRRTIRRS
jgi:hypothetical protein